MVLLPDQAVQPREGILVPFLGRPAWTTDAPAKMALRQESAIVFGFCIPGTTGHRLEFEEPIRVDQLSDDEKNAEALTDAHQRRHFPPYRSSPGVMVVDARPLEGERAG